MTPPSIVLLCITVAVWSTVTFAIWRGMVDHQFWKTGGNHVGWRPFVMPPFWPTLIVYCTLRWLWEGDEE